MEKNSKIVLISVLILTIYSLTVGMGSAIPTVGNITLYPEEPAPMETVTFTAEITSEESIDEVWLRVEECARNGNNICFADSRQNLSMVIIEDTNDYTVAATLIHDDPTYIKYHLEILTGEGWHSTETTEQNLSIDTSNGDTNGNGTPNGGNGDTDGTPGFEVIPFLIAIVIGSKSALKATDILNPSTG